MNNLYARSVFFVQDAERSLRFYTEQLGFSEDWNVQEEGRTTVPSPGTRHESMGEGLYEWLAAHGSERRPAVDAKRRPAPPNINCSGGRPTEALITSNITGRPR